MTDAIKALNEMNAKYQAHKTTVSRECDSLTVATALMKKWGELTLNDAIYREAKSRACRA